VSEPSVITIAVAADERIIREALRCLLERESDFRIVGHATTGRDALRLVTRRKPHVLLVRAALPGPNGLELTRQVHEQVPATAVILIARFVAEWHLLAALRNGAAGYVSSLAQESDLARAIRRAAAGGRYVSAPFARDGVEAWVRRVRNGEAADPFETLTTREREILRLVAEGYSSVRIAGRLSISPRTAESHRANVMRKLRLSNYVELIRYALVRGILPMVDVPARSN
jgi:two-component system, NarL family, response regulator NreC